MVITRTPLRMSFFGGGTDYPIWYREHGGAVLSTTINKYCHIFLRYLPQFFSYKYLLRYIIREEVESIDDIKHPVVRECLRFLKINRGIEMTYAGDVPAQSGLGSSSAFTVGFLHAIYALQGKIVTKRQLAREAIYMEQDVLKENVGSQDQVAAAFGGLNRIDFGGHREFYVNPITLDNSNLDYLKSYMMLFFTGLSRTASEIAGEQIKKTKDKKKELHIMSEMVDRAIEILQGSKTGYEDFGRLLNEAWMLKRSLTDKISNPEIDSIYDIALKNGALGGKLLGAGGGGFILIFADPERHNVIREKLGKLLYVPFAFEELGTQIIFYSTQDI